MEVDRMFASPMQSETGLGGKFTVTVRAWKRQEKCATTFLVPGWVQTTSPRSGRGFSGYFFVYF